MISRANKESLDKRCQMNVTFKMVGKVVCKGNEKGIENPYMLYNLFGLKFIMMQWKTFFVVRTRSGNIILSDILGER